MEFITYTHDGKAVISPAALTLSKLEQEDMLELHALDNALVMLKSEATLIETVEIIESLTRLASSLTVNLLSEFSSDAEDGENECDGNCAACDCYGDDTIPVPAEAFEDAGLLGKHLCAQVIGNTVVISEDTEYGEG